jgi:genome maintenance exonuclease 1
MFNHIHHDFPKLVQENVDGARCYVTPTGEKYASVTTVLSNYKKKELMEWRARVGEEKANEISRKATTRGTGVHKAIERHLLNEEVDVLRENMMPNVRNLFVKMKKELVKINNIHCLESKLFSHELKLAGQVDCVAEYNGVLSVIDFKTSVRLKKKEDIENYFMQGVAYGTMFTELTGLPFEQVVIIIGVDTADFCQTMSVKGDDLKVYREKLQGYIDEYYRTHQFSK